MFAERFAEGMPTTKLIGVPAAGHSPMENEPGEVAKALCDFFAA